MGIMLSFRKILKGSIRRAIRLVTKQQIILAYLNGMSNREIDYIIK